MKVLIACEWSGIVRDAFIKNGHSAVSCDLIPSESSRGLHYQGNVMDIINDGWDLMIAHPPCTYLCKAQIWRTLKEKERRLEQKNAIEFVQKLFESNIPRIAIENPMGILTKVWKKPNQLVYPYQFGDPYKKDIHFWLKNLPPLMPTKHNKGRKSVSNHTNSRMTQEERSKIKSKFFPGLAKAMADQWGDERNKKYVPGMIL